MRAVLYCRVSDPRQVDNLSLPTQEAACRAYCAREGYAVDAVFVDAGESAKATSRPEFQAMLGYCRKHRSTLHAVVVYGLSRFSRSATDHHAIAAVLRGLGLSLRSVTEPIDDSPAGRLMEGILASMHQFDNDQKAQRSRAGMLAATERGRWVWKAPLGYRVGRKGEPSLVVLPEIAGPLAEAWPAIAERGELVPDVLRRLQLAGVNGRRGKPLSLSTLHAILRAPVYAGRIESAKLGASVPGDWTPLVTPAVQAATRARLSKGIPAAIGPVRPRPRVNADFPLRRFVRCGACGRGLTGSWTLGRSKRYGYYQCPSGCQGARVGRDDLEAAFLVFLDASRPSPGYAALFRETALAAVREVRAEESATRAGIERRRAREHDRLKAYDEAFIVDKVIDRATYVARRQEALEALAATESELSATAGRWLDAESLLSLAELCLSQGSRLWTTAATVGDRIRLQSVIFPSGLVWRDGAISKPPNARGFYQLDPVEPRENGLVAQPAVTWHQLRDWFEPWRVFAESGGAALLSTC